MAVCLSPVAPGTEPATPGFTSAQVTDWRSDVGLRARDPGGGPGAFFWGLRGRTLAFPSSAAAHTLGPGPAASRPRLHRPISLPDPGGCVRLTPKLQDGLSSRALDLIPSAESPCLGGTWHRFWGLGSRRLWGPASHRGLSGLATGRSEPWMPCPSALREDRGRARHTLASQAAVWSSGKGMNLSSAVVWGVSVVW